METIISALFESYGAPAATVAVISLLVRLNNSIDAQKNAMVKLFHDLDKRVAVIESKEK